MDKEFKRRLAAYLTENFSEEVEEFAPPVMCALAIPPKFNETFEKKSPKFFEEKRAKIESKYFRYSLSRPKLNKFFEENKGETFSEMLLRLIEESGEKNSAVYNRAKITRQHFHRIKHNENYQPNKDTAIAFALALKLDLNAAKNFLSSAGFTLSKSRRDLIITFFIKDEIFDVDELNDCLYEFGEAVLFKNK